MNPAFIASVRTSFIEYKGFMHFYVQGWKIKHYKYYCSALDKNKNSEFVCYIPLGVENTFCGDLMCNNTLLPHWEIYNIQYFGNKIYDKNIVFPISLTMFLQK